MRIIRSWTSPTFRVLEIGVVAAGLSCAVDEAIPATGQARAFTFEGTYTRNLELAEGAADCGPIEYEGGPTAGVVVIDEGGSSPTARVDAVGCRIGVVKDAEGRWSAANQACQFDGLVSMRDLGVTAMTVDEFLLESSTKTMNVSGRMTRRSSSGPVVACFRIAASVRDR